MKYACNTCGARYAIPDSRVMAAGEQGLRVRCSRCRAIMAVCFGDRDDVIHDDDITQPLGLRRHRSAKVERASEVIQALPTEVGMAAADAGPAPAALSKSGVYRPLPGVGRGVTGVHMPRASAAMPGRDWYAAFGGRPRGPFSRAELELLAEQGRVRSSTLVWRPGFAEWRRVKDRDRDLEWLRGVVVERKRRERAASDKAAREHGIHRLHLDDFASPPNTPPPLPSVTDDGQHAGSAGPPRVLFLGRSLPGRSSKRRQAASAEDFAADRVFGTPHLGEGPAQPASLRHRRRRNALAFAAGALFAGLGVVLVSYTLPALGMPLATVVEAALALAR